MTDTTTPLTFTSLEQLLEVAITWQQRSMDRLAALQAEIDTGRLRSFQNFKDARSEVNLLRAETRVYGAVITALGGNPLDADDEDEEE